jgi:5'(3')-deoxyribonucleotidase
MNIVVDMDQIICQWLERTIEWYNEDKKTSYTREDIKSWNVTDNLPHSKDFIRSVMRYPEMYRDLDPVEGALYGMRDLLAAGHDVVIATAVPKCAGIVYHGKLEWCRRMMPFFPLDNFIAIQRKDLLAAWGDVLFDDGLHNIVPWAMKGKPAVILDCPWNIDYVPAEGLPITRVKHWNEFLQYVEYLSIQTPSKGG